MIAYPSLDGAQPMNDGQAAGIHALPFHLFPAQSILTVLFIKGTPFVDKVGLGKPTESPYVPMHIDN